jgi:hypothetical protein
MGCSGYLILFGMLLFVVVGCDRIARQYGYGHLVGVLIGIAGWVIAAWLYIGLLELLDSLRQKRYMRSERRKMEHGNGDEGTKS